MPVMSKRQLEGAWAKLERAKYHLEQLRVELSTHQHSEGATFVDDVQARQHVFTYRPPRQRFINYAILSGEIVSQTRTALEHAVFDMVPTSGRSGFPVYLDSREYEKKGAPLIERLNDESQRLIGDLQPFENDGKDSLLWILHDMWNTDKHRFLHIVGADFAGIARNYRRDGRIVQQFTGLPAKLQDGAELRIDFPDVYEPGQLQVEVGIRLEFEAAPGQAIDTLLTKFIEFGENTIRQLAGTL
jgi:hypothetical protein